MLVHEMLTVTACPAQPPHRVLVPGNVPVSLALVVKSASACPLQSRGRMFWLWWKTLLGSYVVFTSTSRS
jgi:hypothetical protein